MKSSAGLNYGYFIFYNLKSSNSPHDPLFYDIELLVSNVTDEDFDILKCHNNTQTNLSMDNTFYWSDLQTYFTGVGRILQFNSDVSQKMLNPNNYTAN